MMDLALPTVLRQVSPRTQKIEIHTARRLRHDENRLNERIRSAYSHATPDCLDKILASCEDRKGTVII